MPKRTLFALCLSFIFIASTGCSLPAVERDGPGQFYVIGTGPSGPEHATLKAIECMKKADLLLCTEDTVETFGEYLKGKPILANPWEGLFYYRGKSWDEFTPEDRKAMEKVRVPIRDEIVHKIRDEVAKGKHVALLDSGDPCTFGPGHWIIEGFAPDEVEIVPGLGAYEAASAALKKSNIPGYDTRFVLLTAPGFFLGKAGSEEMIQNLSRYPHTMVFYMGLEVMDQLIPLLKKYHRGDLPVAVVYYAGYPGKEKVVRGTLDTILERTAAEEERWMGMIFVGKNLEGNPYRSRLEKEIPTPNDSE